MFSDLFSNLEAPRSRWVSFSQQKSEAKRQLWLASGAPPPVINYNCIECDRLQNKTKLKCKLKASLLHLLHEVILGAS